LQFSFIESTGIQYDLGTAASMPVKGTIGGADLYEDIKKVLQSVDNPIQKPAALVTD
jgi:hypothetical protein